MKKIITLCIAIAIMTLTGCGSDQETMSRKDRKAKDRPCEYITWSNWKNCPHFGDLVHDGPLDPERYETINNTEMLERILPIEDEFHKSWYEKHKFTVGQVNEVLMWWWKTADTSVTWDW